MRVTRLLSIAALALVACGGSSESDSLTDPAATLEAGTGESFRMRTGTIARVGTDDLFIAFRGVRDDSRCPIDVVCVWAGDATVRIQAAVGRSGWTSFELHTGLDPQSVRFGNRTITLVAVEPARRADVPVDPDQYVITLRVD
jgi:hypothetical protein